MGPRVVARALAAWFVMLAVAMMNGAARDLLYGPYLSELAANQLSCASGIVLLGAVMWAFVRRFPPASARQAVALGLFWTVLTVAFEFLFFHFAAGRSWSALLAEYDLLAGRLWLLVLVWVAVAPFLLFRLARS